MIKMCVGEVNWCKNKRRIVLKYQYLILIYAENKWFLLAGNKAG